MQILPLKEIDPIASYLHEKQARNKLRGTYTSVNRRYKE